MTGFLEVGLSEDGKEVIVNHPDLKPDENGVGHIVFSPTQAISLALLLLEKADAAGLRIFTTESARESLTLSESIRAEAATVKLGQCMPPGRFPEGVSRYNALMWAVELIEDRLKGDLR